ncbi:MAG: hypothetical protein C0413_01045, partial [Clostridiales bacterium]|nr:hypothetical protein [Clostridiales bacterium]
MFKEQYIRDNDKLKAKETLLMEIKEKHTRERIALTPRQKFVRFGAVFAAFALIAVGAFGTLLVTGGDRTPAPESTMMSAAAENAATSSADVMAPAASQGTTGTTKVDVPASVESYDDIYSMIESMQSAYGGVMMEGANGVMAAPAAGEAKTDMATQEAAAPSASMDSTGVDYSGTNVQVKGVDEADIVKTDGSYIYYVAGNQLNILKPDGANTTLVSSTSLSAEDMWWGYNSEMFVLGNRLVIITQSFNTVWVNDASGSYQTNTDQTSAVIYDITNPAKPAQVVSLGQSGYYVSSRMIGDYVYLVTSQYIYSPVKGTPITYIPSTTVGAENKLLPPADLYVGPNPQNAAYTVIGSINL